MRGRVFVDIHRFNRHIANDNAFPRAFERHVHFVFASAAANFRHERNLIARERAQPGLRVLNPAAGREAFARRLSAYARVTATGTRSSYDASEVNRRARRNESSSDESIRFSVRVSSPSSSFVGSSGTRRDRSPPAISSAQAMIRRIGDRNRFAIQNPISAAITGTPSV